MPGRVCELSLTNRAAHPPTGEAFPSPVAAAFRLGFCRPRDPFPPAAGRNGFAQPP
jgi:hypothetical protein